MRVAAVDLGTNSLRLLVADAAPGRAAVDVVRRLEIVRLGEGVDASGRVGDAALARVGRVLDDYAAQVRALGVERLRAVATSATRDAANRADVVDVARRHLGTDLDVLSGDEEAALTFAGALSGLPSGASGPVLVVDVGGGSTELALGGRPGGEAAGRPERAASLDVGSVRLFERHLLGPAGPDGSPGPADPPTAAQVAAVEADVDAALDRAGLPLATARTVLAVAGTATSVAALAVRAGTWDDLAVDGALLTPDRLDEVVRWLVTAPRSERAATPEVHPGRVDVLPSGALVLRAVVRRAPGAVVLVGVRDLLDGAAASLLPDR